VTPEQQATRLNRVRAGVLRDLDRIWADMFDPNDPAGSLARIGPLVAARIRVAQGHGLNIGVRYADSALTDVFGPDALPVWVPPEAYVGVDRYGRDIARMLAGGPAVYGLRVASGTDPADAAAREQSFQRRVAGSATHDTNRRMLTDLADPQSEITHPQIDGWARIAHASACEFCNMLAGRGYAYTSQKTAAAAADGSRYHDHCRCTVSVNPMPRGYRDATAEQLYKAWADAGGRTQWGAGNGGRTRVRSRPRPPRTTPPTVW
jgi:hypothetical protein